MLPIGACAQGLVTNTLSAIKIVELMCVGLIRVLLVESEPSGRDTSPLSAMTWFPSSKRSIRPLS